MSTRPQPVGSPRRGCVAVAVLTLTVAVGGGCGGDGEDAKEPTPLVSTPATTGDGPSLPGELHRIGEGRLEAGQVFESSRFSVPVSFTVPELFFGIESPSLLMLTKDPTDPPSSPGIVFLTPRTAARLDDVLLPLDQQQTEMVQHLRPIPKDLVGWLRSIPHLGVQRVTTADVAGHPATVIDYSVESLPVDANSCPDPNCLLVAAVEDVQVLIVLLAGYTGSIYIVEAAQPVLILVGAPATELEAFRPVIEAFVDGVEIG